MGSGASGKQKAELAQSQQKCPDPGPSSAAAASSASASSEVPVLAKRDGLEILFLDDLATERILRFQERPLGFEISLGVTPIRVDNVYGQGQSRRLGVEMGWYVMKVNGRDLSDKTFEDQFAMLKQALAGLPLSKDRNVSPTLQSLEVVFEAGSDGREVPVVFSKKPLGFEFDMIAPIKVKAIQEECVARRHGVEVGWVVKKVAGEDLSSRSFTEQVELLKKCVYSLPDVTYCIAPPLGHSLSANSVPPPRRTDRAADAGGADADDGRL